MRWTGRRGLGACVAQCEMDLQEDLLVCSRMADLAPHTFADSSTGGLSQGLPSMALFLTAPGPCSTRYSQQQETGEARIVIGQMLLCTCMIRLGWHSHRSG